MTLYDYYSLTVHCFYIILSALAILINGLLIYLIKSRSPLTLWSFKLLLMYTASVQILIGIIAVVLQGRLLRSTSVTALLPIGPCRLVGPSTCFAAYNILIALSLHTEVLIIHTMHYRYRMMQPIGMSTGRLQIGLIVAVVLPIVVLILPYTQPLDFDKIMNITIREHPGQVEDYGEFGGYTSSEGVQMIIYVVISSTVVVASPIIIVCFKHLILRELHNAQEEHSDTIKNISRVFMKVSANYMEQLLAFLLKKIVTAVTPSTHRPSYGTAVFYLPLGLLFYLSNALHWNLIIVEYLVAATAALPCAIDPLFTIYFVTPYREWVSKKFRRLNFTEVRWHCLQGSTTVSAVSASVHK